MGGDKYEGNPILLHLLPWLRWDPERYEVKFFVYILLGLVLLLMTMLIAKSVL
jgi:hypothetical protein